MLALRDVFRCRGVLNLGDILTANNPANPDLGFQFLIDGESTAFTGAVVYGPLTPVGGLMGDFNSDSSVDGLDFLAWQRGSSPNNGSPGDLAKWQAGYGQTAPSAAVSSAVPEPSSVALILLGATLLLASPKRRLAPPRLR